MSKQMGMIGVLMKGFKGYVDVYGEEIYVNTFTGEGYERVIVKLDKLLYKFAHKTYINNYDFDDIKSELTRIAIEGIMAYDPSSDAKLTSFLFSHINNKRLSLLTKYNTSSRDASIYSSEEDPHGRIVAQAEMPFSSFTAGASSSPGSTTFSLTDPIDFASSGDNFYQAHFSGVEKFLSLEFEIALNKATLGIDNRIKDVLELVYYMDYTIEHAAHEVGIPAPTAAMKIKKLAKKDEFKELFHGFLSNKKLSDSEDLSKAEGDIEYVKFEQLKD